ncbi:MAG: putative Zn-dependent peptidase [Nonlabens sp.]|jgi:predicted Zn-dependent peptidase|uniref:M16 family metallopeptidase n=1 Tax=Nonlabens sp. TaxID=1888209 RepID=UPI0039E488F1
MNILYRKIAVVICIAFISFNAAAQLDRSKMPQAGPEPIITLEKPVEFQLKNGIKILVVENNKLPRVSYQLSIDNQPVFEGQKAGVLDLLSSMLGNGTTSISKDKFNDEVDFLGASLNFSSSGAYASSLSRYSERILELMADAAINPLLTKEEFEKEKEKLIESLKTGEKSVDATAARVVSALAYGKDHVYGEFITEETIENVTFEDVLEYYKRGFAPNNAYIVVVGDIKAKQAKKQIKKYFKNWDKEDIQELPAPILTPNVKSSEINFIDMPNAVQSDISITNNVSLKQSDSDYFSSLMANNILGGGGEGYLFKNLREDKAYTYGAYSSLGASRYGVSRFNASAKVRNQVTDSAVVEFFKEIKRIRTEPVNPQTLIDAKAKYVGNFVMALERPQTIASYALNIKRNNLPEDFYANYLENINGVTVEDVQRVANKYFKLDNSRVVIVGKASDVLDNLEKMEFEGKKLPVKFYDKYASPTERPSTITLPAGTTAQSVINGYLQAIGGAEKLDNVSSIVQTMNASFQGQKMVSTIKQKSPNLMLNEISIVGMGTVLKQAFDGEKGYMVQMGQKIDMPAEITDVMKGQTGLFKEQTYLNGQYILTLKGAENLNGSNAYVVIAEDNSGKKTTNYYDMESGFKMQTVEVAQGPNGQEVSQVTTLGDYKSIDGIYFPHTMVVPMAGQSITMKTTEINVNQVLQASDFQ